MKNTFKKSLKTNTLISPVTNSSPNYLLSAIFLPISPDDIISHYEPQLEWSNSLFTASRITTHISCHHLTQIYARFSTTMVISIGKLLLNFIIPNKSTIKFLRYNIAVSKKTQMNYDSLINYYLFMFYKMEYITHRETLICMRIVRNQCMTYYEY